MSKIILKDIQFKPSIEEGEVPLSGVHTRNGDTIELHFKPPKNGKGALTFGYSGGWEQGVVKLDFTKRQLSFITSDCAHPKPCKLRPLRIRKRNNSHVLVIEKSEGTTGKLVKNASINVLLDGESVLSIHDMNLLPEMGVSLYTRDTLVQRFIHRGLFFNTPEYLHVGAWQMLNNDSIKDNLESLFRGLKQASEKGVQLMVTPETSLTGRVPRGWVISNQTVIAKAEAQLRKFIQKLKNAPYLVVGFPIWENTPGHRPKNSLYNACRVYDPDGCIISTHKKIHPCVQRVSPGCRLQEFDVYDVPVSMQICDDGRYPEVWILPVMFGARLVLHPVNPGGPGWGMKGSIDAFESEAKKSTNTMHAFYVRVSGGGGSYISGPDPNENPIAVSSEWERDSKSFPMIGEPQECLIDAKIRIADAFGYWPMRSFRASEEIASAYYNLYKAMGGKRRPL